MDTVSLHSLILVRDDRSSIIEKIKQVQDKLKHLSSTFQNLSSRFESIMFDWIVFTINGINWDLAIQLQEVLDDLKVPVIHIGSSGSGLSDLSQLKKGRFDTYLISLLYDFDKLEEFVMHFLSYTKIMDYCLNLWQDNIITMTDIEQLNILGININYAPLNSLIEERITELQPEKDEKQTSLDDFFQ